MKRCLFFFPLFCDAEMLKFKEYYSHRVHQIIGDIILDENSISNIKIIKESIPDYKISNFMMIIILIAFLVEEFMCFFGKYFSFQDHGLLPQCLNSHLAKIIPIIMAILFCVLIILPWWYYTIKTKTELFVLWIEIQSVVTSPTISQTSEDYYRENLELGGSVQILNNYIFSTLFFVCIIITNFMSILANILEIIQATNITENDDDIALKALFVMVPVIFLIFCIWKFILEIRMYKWLKRMITPISFLTELENNFCNFKNNEITMEEFHKIVSDIIARYTTNL